MKRIKLFLIFIFTLISAAGIGQQSFNYKTVDSISYQLYLNQDWEALSSYGSTAIKNGIDYYYLRMRTGIADYEREKYAFAATEFEKAMQFNSHDLNAKSYLYWSYVTAGKSSRANRLSKYFTEKQKIDFGIKRTVVSNIDFYAGYLFSNNYEKNGEIDMTAGPAIYGEQLLIGNQFFIHLGADFNITHSFGLKATVNFIDIDKKSRFQFNQNQERTYDGDIRQTELYLNGKVQLDQGWSLSLFTNILFIGLNRIDASLGPGFNLQFIEQDTTFVNWVAGISIQKDFNFIVVDLNPSFSRLYDANQFQIDLSMTYYPLGSFNFYGQTGGIYFNELDAELNQENRFLFYQVLGVKLTKRSWLEGSFHSGNLKNVNVYQASVVYNLPQNINFIAGLKLYIFVGERLVLNFAYDISDKAGFYFNNGGADNSFVSYTANYQTHSILGGLKWTF